MSEKVSKKRWFFCKTRKLWEIRAKINRGFHGLRGFLGQNLKKETEKRGFLRILVNFANSNLRAFRDYSDIGYRV
jgi:hypothetical protein